MQKGVVRKRPPGQISEYGRQLATKQELRNEYLLRERKFKQYVQGVLKEKNKEGDKAELLLRKLEMRLDNAVFRMGFSPTRAGARQLVSHGHVFVNGRLMDVPSFQIKPRDIISVKPASLNNAFFKNLPSQIKSYTPPSWIELNKEKMEGTIKNVPTASEVVLQVDLPLVFEFYSR
ncbi:MAG: 30S ribosomal protein S4 [Candidatus Wildermuthbacteria bacterium]|nr:30S ribosomal protein S4 [Candidatus Wildermuthbacteria bacterium]